MKVQEKISCASLIASLPEKQRNEILRSYSDEQLEALRYDWDFWARPDQKTPAGEWIKWLVLAGRGYGKTRVGAEQVIKWKNQGYKRFTLMAKTPAEARDIMIQGESGILACSPPWDVPDYKPSNRSLTWKNGAMAHIYSGENYDQSRGSQCEKAWIDELAKYRYPQEALDNVMLGLRLGDNPQIVITTTPKPIKTIKEIVKDDSTVVTKGSTFDNIGNLADAFIKTIVKKYENTRLGRQELYADILDDNPNALWRRSDIDDHRISGINFMNPTEGQTVPKLVRIVIGVDPAVTSGDEADDTGIVVAAKDDKGHGYILDDLTLNASPDGWGKAAVATYYKWSADRIIGEANNGGDMIEYLLRTIDRNVSYKKVHATRGKLVRAEPIAALYEQGKIHHVGYFADLEDQYCEWQPGDKSPNNMDAAVWALTELFSKDNLGPIIANI